MNLWREYALALEAYHENAMDIAHEVDCRTGPSLELLEKQRGLEERLTKTKVDLKTIRDNPGACHNCGGEGQVVQHHGPDDNYDGVVCVTCDGSGLAHSPVQEMVREFHAAFLPEQTRSSIGIPSDDLVRLRVKLPFEEAFELLRASFAPTHKNDADELWAHVQRLIRTAKVQVNIVEVADAFADLAYVVEGGNLAYGIDSRAVLAEVHASNMSKVGGHRGESGKWIKPPTYRPADVASVLKKQGWQP